MAEELDAQVTPEVQETPTAEQVPETAIFEPRNVAEAMEMELPPTPAPEAPPPEPDAPVVEPDWLSEPPVVPEQPPAQYPPNVPEYDYGYTQPQPQVQQGPASDAALNAFVENPEGFIERQVAARLQQLTTPLQQQTQSIAFVTNQMLQNSVNQGMANVDSSIRKAYEKFNQDSAFRSNSTMQNLAKETLQGMRENAIREARYGNFAPLTTMANISEADIAGTLAYVRAKAGVLSPGAEGPLQVEGATVESSRSPVAEQSVQLTAEQEEIARRMGPGYRQKLINAQADLQKYDDLEWKE